MSKQAYKLKKPFEYGGVLITEMTYDDDPDEMTPAQLADIDVTRLTIIGEMTKAVAAMTKNPVDMIESMKMGDWSHMAVTAQKILGNAMGITTESLPT
jgi:hypothetical protein